MNKEFKVHWTYFSLILIPLFLFFGSFCVRLSGAEKQGSEVQESAVESQGREALPIRVREVIDRGKILESAYRWSEALKLYEDELRTNPDVLELQRRFNFARLHRDIARRYADVKFRNVVLELQEEDISTLSRDILAKFNQNYVSSLTPRQIVSREVNGLEIALSDPVFLDIVLPEATPAQLVDFRNDIYRLMQEKQIETDKDVYDATLEIGVLARRHFPTASSGAIVLESLCGLINTLDPYSSILTPTQLQDMLSSIRGNFIGLGVEIRMEYDHIVVQRVIPGSPAEEAGVRKGDVVLGVDGHSLQSSSADKAAFLLQGEPGSYVLLQLVAQDGSETREVKVKRETVVIPPVENPHVIPESGGIAYIRIPTFQDDSASVLNTTLWDLYHKGMTGLILDLRGNPGGLLTAAIDMADLFLDEGIIVSTRGSHGYQNQHYRAKKGNAWRVPLVVIIDRESASASEIFAGAIRDNRRGQIVGEQSFGKGSVQGIYQLSRKQLGVKLTTSLFYSPSGQGYNHVGVSPHFTVRQAARPIIAQTAAAVGNEAAEISITSVERGITLQKPETPTKDMFLETAIHVLRPENSPAPEIAGGSY